MTNEPDRSPAEVDIAKNTYTAGSAGAFLKMLTSGASRCVRCSSEINDDDDWCSIAQVLLIMNKPAITGGAICAPCYGSWQDWMREANEPRALEPEGECDYALSESYANARVWIGIKEPGGARSADVGVMFNEDGVSIDVWNGSDEGSEQVIQPWLLWDDLESREGRPEKEEV
jgi:hypothetical protein